MRKIKARIAISTLVTILTVLGLLGGVGATYWVFYNWDAAYTEEFDFAVNMATRTKDWVGLNGDSEIQSVQTSGNSKCKYTLKVRTRTNSTYSTIYSNVSYSENDVPSAVSTYKFGNWVDYKFQMKKTAGTSTASNVRLMVEIND
ncbi:MAG: hypothetical protein IJB96_12025 [Lachnospira sp.]|nr:hypothetical protein [Lachnospira sp.]